MITVAGAWVALLVFYRLLDNKSGSSSSVAKVDYGVTWGIFVTLLAGVGLSYAGWRIHQAHHPEPPLPGEEPTSAVSPDAARTEVAPPRRRRRPPPPDAPTEGQLTFDDHCSRHCGDSPGLVAQLGEVRPRLVGVQAAVVAAEVLLDAGGAAQPRLAAGGRQDDHVGEPRGEAIADGVEQRRRRADVGAVAQACRQLRDHGLRLAHVQEDVARRAGRLVLREVGRAARGQTSSR